MYNLRLQWNEIINQQKKVRKIYKYVEIIHS